MPLASCRCEFSKPLKYKGIPTDLENLQMRGDNGKSTPKLGYNFLSSFYRL